jgi:predicted molibdopterin-dependent oxidoreductase YjgC
LRVRITSVVRPGQLFVPFHFFEANVNVLTLDAVDPISREPNFKQTPVRLERMSEGAVQGPPPIERRKG